MIMAAKRANRSSVRSSMAFPCVQPAASPLVGTDDEAAGVAPTYRAAFVAGTVLMAHRPMPGRAAWSSRRLSRMTISRDMQLLIAAVAAIAGIAGALILPNFWLRLIVLVVGLAIAAYVTGVLQQFLAGL